MDAPSASSREANEIVNSAQRLTASDEPVKIDVEIMLCSVAWTFENDNHV
jgi:hypothetical protein